MQSVCRELHCRMRSFRNKGQLLKIHLIDPTFTRSLLSLMSINCFKFRETLVAPEQYRNAAFGLSVAHRHSFAGQNVLRQTVQRIAAVRAAAASNAVSQVENPTTKLQQRRLRSGVAVSTCKVAAVGPVVVNDASLLMLPTIHDATFPKGGGSDMKLGSALDATDSALQRQLTGSLVHSVPFPGVQLPCHA